MNAYYSIYSPSVQLKQCIFKNILRLRLINIEQYKKTLLKIKGMFYKPTRRMRTIIIWSQ